MRLTTLALIGMLGFSVPCWADAFYLKTGEIVRGKLVEKKNGNYTLLSSDGETVTLPAAMVSIADIDPASTAFPKGTVSVLAGGTEEDSEAPPAENRSRVLVNPPPTPPVETPANQSAMDVLKNAQETVELSNARTEQSQKNIEEMKMIADGA